MGAVGVPLGEGERTGRAVRVEELRPWGWALWEPFHLPVREEQPFALCLEVYRQLGAVGL